MKIDLLKKKLKNKKIILMDGAMGTEILNRGVKTTIPLWSAEALLTHPEVVQQIHEDYIRAGAEIIITDTFRTTKRAFGKKAIAKKARNATLLACKLAKQAIKNSNVSHDVFIAGSVAPLEDCYSPEFTPSDEELVVEHDAYIKDLKDGGADFILLETMITLREVWAALKAVRKYKLPFAVSFCINKKNQLLGGESLVGAIKEVEKYKPLFIGVNCIDPKIATKAVGYLRKITNLPIGVYAQGDGGPDDDQGWRFTKKEKEKIYINAAKQWIRDGAQVIGGCCGTTPGYIKRIKSFL